MPLAVIVLDTFSDRPAPVALPEREHPVKTFVRDERTRHRW